MALERSLLISTILNYILAFIALILLHSVTLFLVMRHIKRKYPDMSIEVPKILRVPRFEVLIALHAAKGLTLSCVTALKLSCDAPLKIPSYIILLLQLLAAAWVVVKVRSGIGTLVKFHRYDPRHRKVLVQRVSGHLRDFVSFQPKGQHWPEYSERESGVRGSVGGSVHDSDDAAAGQ